MTLTTETRDRLAGIAQAHGFSPQTAEGMLEALRRGGGAQAQFDLPEAGGMGQWSSGGMLMIGRMFDSGLKARVQALIADLRPVVQSLPQDRGDGGDDGWPADLGTPGASGAQGDMRYAVFPDTRRLAIRQRGRLSVYDTGDHRIGGVSQQQGGDSSLTFASQHGPVALDRLTAVPLRDKEGDKTAAPAAESDAAPPAPSPADPSPAAPPPPPSRSDDGAIPAKIEQLHDLFTRNILTREEYEAKKADLLSRF